MKFFLIRRIDLFVGFLLCHILAFFNRISGKTRKRSGGLPEAPQKVLIVKFLGFGSILMTTPLMAALKKNFPEVEIHFLTFSGNVPICQSISLIDKIFDLERKSFRKFTVSLIKNFNRIRRQNYDVVFNLEFFSNFSLLFSSLSRAKHVICFGGRHEYRKILGNRIISYENETHIIDKFCNFLKPLNIELDSTSKQLVELNENSDSRKNILDLLEKKQVDISRDFLVVVNINASEMSSIRKWPIENFFKVISFLLNKDKVKVILIGGKEDVTYVSQLEKMIPASKGRVINLSGLISLKELISLMKVSRLYFGNDSGPLHLAEACRLPNVSFFGPESPKIYGHPDDRNYVFYSNLSCSPCLNVYTNKDTYCTDNICLKVITPDDVIKFLEEKYFRES